MAEHISDLKNDSQADQAWSWNRKQLLGLSPDIITVKATARLIDPARWEQLGQNDRLVWGLFSRRKLPPHQIFVQKSDLTGSCSCNGLKHPCKFFIALLVLYTDKPALFEQAETPDWIDGQSAVVPVTDLLTTDHQILVTFKTGMEEFSRWLRDQVRHGIADFAERIPADLESMANRLIDSHMPRIANELRLLGQAVTPRKGKRPDDWPETLIKGLGRFYLLTQAWERFDLLSAAEQNDLIEACVELPTFNSQLSTNSVVADDWLVIGRKFEALGQKWHRRMWLYGTKSQRFALIKDAVSVRKIPLSHLVTGTTYSGDFQFAETTTPILGRLINSQLMRDAVQYPKGASAVDFVEAEADYMKASASNPWLRQWPVLLRGVRLHFDSVQNCWHVIDAQDQAVQLLNGKDTGWYLLAASHGRPIDLFGEWSRQGLTLISIFYDDEWLDLTVWGNKT